MSDRCKISREAGEELSRENISKNPVADLRGCEGLAPHPRPNSFNFMQFLGKFGKIVCWCPPRRFGAPPRGNPGSINYGRLSVKLKEKEVFWPIFLHRMYENERNFCFQSPENQNVSNEFKIELQRLKRC